ncbi:uncharacterized protein LOC143572951 [Bidens hawaiensis]|uniref:uncharacterized protein LOC143572951 n=1 Tax=Bidens hawaiensis TaxID=980011 RepID=UPI00404ADA3D
MVNDKTESSSSNKVENGPDVNSPLYLHPSDYPKQLHVNETLNDHNYTDWSQEMMNFLFAKNKVGFVDGSIKKPEKSSSDYMPWMRCDAMIKGWLTTAMEKEIRASVKYAGKYAYYTKLRSIWDEISSVLPTPRCTCDGCSCDIGRKVNEAKEKERLYEFLMGLDNEFSVIKTQILATKPIPNLNNAYHLVAEDERQRSISFEKKPTESAAFKVSLPNRREGNSSREAPKRDKATMKETKRNDLVDHCTFCGKDGHNKEGCFKRIGYPEWWPAIR